MSDDGLLRDATVSGEEFRDGLAFVPKVEGASVGCVDGFGQI
jgi:hypothetical protein